jgi:BASS family bile acid:Na+ symporter
MTWILARTILLPIGLGLVCRAFFPTFAEKAAPVLAMAGSLGLLIVVLFAVAAFYPALLNMDAWSYLVIVAVCATALGIGHRLGPDQPSERVTLAVECGVRHPALAVTIVSANYGQELALPVLVPCVITFIAVAMLYMIWQRKTRKTGLK